MTYGQPYAPLDLRTARAAAAARLRDALAQALHDVHLCLYGPCGPGGREAACARVLAAIELRNYAADLCERDPDCPEEWRSAIAIADAVIAELVDACGVLKLRER